VGFSVARSNSTLALIKRGSDAWIHTHTVAAEGTPGCIHAFHCVSEEQGGGNNPIPGSTKSALRGQAPGRLT